MFGSQALRASSSFLEPAASRIASIRGVGLKSIRHVSTTPTLYKYDGRQRPKTPSAESASGEHEGSFARTNKDVRVDYPEEHDLPSSIPVQGRGGLHFKRTLASFSLEGRVGVVTGGARGLGLVMSQALVVSGADVAIVDLNSKFLVELARLLNYNRPKAMLSQRRRQTGKQRN